MAVTDTAAELLERTEALDALDELLRESGNAGRIALVAGEAGIGKTSLLQEFAERCGRRPGCWSGRARTC